MSVPERLGILTQSAFWKIAGPLYIPYLVSSIFLFIIVLKILKRICLVSAAADHGSGAASGRFTAEDRGVDSSSSRRKEESNKNVKKVGYSREFEVKN